MQGRWHGEVESELASDCGAGLISFTLAIIAETRFEESGGIIHRATLEAGEWEDTSMRRGITTHRLELAAASRLLRHPVGICAAEACGTRSLVAIDHDMMACGLIGDIEHMVYHPLRSVMLAARDDGTYITGLDGIIAMIVHKGESAVELALIIGGIGGSLMVHNDLNATTIGISLDRIDIEIGVRGIEEELAILAKRAPILPALIPPLDENSVDIMIGSEIDILQHIGGVGGMAAVWGQFVVVGDAGLGAVIVGISPCFLVSDEHLPPYTDELHRADPGGIFEGARFVEVIDELGGEDIAGIIADDECAPRSGERELEITGHAEAVGHEVRGEGEPGSIRV